MKEFDIILDECIDQIRDGASTLDECLARYPEHAAQLRPLLKAAHRMERGRAVVPSTDFKVQTRARLNQHMRTHPRLGNRGLSIWRIAAGAVALMLAFLMTSTALAQSALPGDRLYEWKLTSENVWRVVSPDPLGTDLAVSNRRVREMVAVSTDEARVVWALEGYKSLLIRFEAEKEGANWERILPILQSQRDSLAQAGLLIPELDNYILVDSYIEGELSPSPSDAGATPGAPVPTPTPPSH